MIEREKEVIATKRDIKILYYKINLKITQLESRTNERISQLENNTKLEIEKLRAETNERITQLENTTKLEIEKIRAEVEKSKTETQYHITKSESRIIKFILASSIIQTIFIISAVLTIIFAVIKPKT
jgi:anaerobic ribonucleoside-triphosphate reductase